MILIESGIIGIYLLCHIYGNYNKYQEGTILLIGFQMVLWGIRFINLLNFAFLLNFA